MDITSEILKVANNEIEYSKLSHVCPHDFEKVCQDNNWIFDSDHDHNGWQCDWYAYITINEDKQILVMGTMYYGTAKLYNNGKYL